MAGTSALLKSAASVRDQLATYQDSVQAFEYENSAYTDSALSTYQAYLQPRIDALNNSGSISDASKALSLTKALDGATKSNISSTITRENINMMAGNASLTDKYNVIVGQYSRAAANGDMTLAQSLMSQAYSVNQSIQLQAQQAQDAQTTLANAAATAGKAAAASEGSIADSLTESLKQLNNDIKQGGDLNKTVKSWVGANSATLQSLGVKLPNQPNYFDLVNGIAGAQYNHNMLAAQMYAPYGSGPGSEAWNYAQKAYNINAGITTLPTLAGNKSLQEIMQAATNNNQFIYNPSSGKLVQTQQTGNTIHFSENGAQTVEPTFSGTVAHTTVLSPVQTTQMQKLGLSFAHAAPGKTIEVNGKTIPVGADDGVQVQASAKTPVWLQEVLGKNGVTNMYTTTTYDPSGKAQTSLQFSYGSKGGQGNSLYTVVADSQGHLGLFAQGGSSEGYLHGEYGFNPSNIADTSSSGHQSIFGKIAGGFGNMIMGHASADSILGAGTNNFTPPPLPMAQLPPLPSISLAAPPPLPAVNVAPPVANTQGVIPHTVSIQGGNSQVQGGGFNQQQGGSGIKITGTTNGPVGMRI